VFARGHTTKLTRQAAAARPLEDVAECDRISEPLDSRDAVLPKEEPAFMRSHEQGKDRGRPPPDNSWRMLAHLDRDGLTLIGVFLGTLLVLAILFLLAT
jgi:hypothetical protein